MDRVFFAPLRTRHILSALLGITLLFQIANTQSSQQQEPAPVLPKPEPIPAAGIPGRLERTVEELQRIEERLQRSSALIRVDSLLPDYIAKIRAKSRDLSREYLSRLTLGALNDRWDEWTRYSSQLNAWRSVLETRAQNLEEIRLSLQKLQEIWEITRSASREEELPAPLRQTTQTALAAIADHQVMLQRRRSEVLGLLNTVSDEAVRVSEILRLIDQAMSGFSGKLLAQDSPPLWELLTDREKGATDGELSAVNRQKLQRLEEFFEGRSTILFVHLGIAIVVVASLYGLRRKSKTLLVASDGARAREIPHVLRRPVSTAIVVMYVLLRISLPDAPSVFYKVIGLVLLVPLLRLLPLYVSPYYRKVFYVLSGVYLFHRVEALSIDVPTLYRILLLVLTFLALGALLWFERSASRGAAQGRIKAKRWHQVLSRGAGVLLLGSLVSNILGGLGLAELLAEGTLNSLYALVAITAFVLIFGDLFDVLLRTRAGQLLHMVETARDVLTRGWMKLLRFLAIFAGIYLVLASFNLWNPVRTTIGDLLAEEWTLGTWTVTLGSIVALVVTVWASVMLSRIVRFVLETDILPRTNLRRGAQSTISTMAHYTVLLAGLVLATSMIGFKWDTIAIIIGALGVGIGFGLQNLVNNVVSGLILMFERPINVGDTIEFSGRFGEVLRIGLRASTVRTFDGSEVIVPNANLVSSEVVNWTLSDRNRRMEITVGVEYGTDPEKVLELLLRIVGQHALVMKNPEPHAQFTGFGDSSLDFIVRFWSQFEHAYTARSEIMTAINKALNEAGIVIPFPQRDLHLRSVDSTVKESLPAQRTKND